MKKMIITTIALLLASAAHAGTYTANTPWETLLKAPDVEADMPIAFMGHAVSYDFVCKEGNTLRTKEMVDIIETKYGREHNTDVVVGKEYLSTPINYTRVVSDCSYIGQNRTVCQDKVVTGTYPLTVNVKVYKVSHSRDHDRKDFMFTKAFTVPQCN